MISMVHIPTETVVIEASTSYSVTLNEYGCRADGMGLRLKAFATWIGAVIGGDLILGITI